MHMKNNLSPIGDDDQKKKKTNIKVSYKVQIRTNGGLQTTIKHKLHIFLWILAWDWGWYIQQKHYSAIPKQVKYQNYNESEIKRT